MTEYDEYIEWTEPDVSLIERLAELEHEQWMIWADTILKTEKISIERQARWLSLMRPYKDLSEKEKDQDRIWAKKIVKILEKFV